MIKNGGFLLGTPGYSLCHLKFAPAMISPVTKSKSKGFRLVHFGSGYSVRIMVRIRISVRV